MCIRDRFWRADVLRASVNWLGERGYLVVDMDASRWSDEQAMHSDLAGALDFPDYYGHNLDALNDCLSVSHRPTTACPKRMRDWRS